MALKLSNDQSRLIYDATEVLLLGIITAEGEIRLKLADRTTPGHVEWLIHEPLPRAIRGFSLLVKEGRVIAVYPASRINPRLDGQMEDEYVRELCELLPCSDSLRLLRY